MLEYVAYAAPLAVFWLALGVTNYICITAGSLIRRRFALARGGPEERALGVAHGAIFVLTGLILGFSFSYAAARYDARRALVVEEANAIGATYLRAANLPDAAAGRFRTILRDYARARLDVYSNLADSRTSQTMDRRSLALQDNLWSLLVTAERDDTRNVPLSLLTQALNHMIDVHAEQSAALKTHLPIAMLALVLVVSVLSAMLVGVHFERMRGLQTFLGLVVALMLATVVTGIVDLDRPQLGLVRVNLSPLQTQLDDMR